MRIAYAALLPSTPDRRFIRPPLFAGYLSAYSNFHRPGKDTHDIVYAWELAKRQKTKALVERVLSSDPEVVALSVFVWNHNGVARLCRKIRKLSPKTKIVLGGPEVAFTPNLAHTRFDADWVCNGEGEMAFVSLLNEVEKKADFSSSLPGLMHRSDSAVSMLSAPMVRSLDEIPSPYTTGALQLDRDGFVDLETTRGCPYRCRFCLYGKTFDSLRHFSLERTERDIQYVIDHGATAIYLMDPTFNYPRERCRKVCHVLARLNADRKVDFFTEARAEVMDEGLADDFVRAGIKSVELGLQSTSRETLKLMKRGLGTSHFLHGCTLLRERGIAAEIGVIAGLPGDTAESIEETSHFVVDQCLGELTVHRLQVLPGSEYHKMAAEFELEFAIDPPYFIKQTSTLEEADITGVIDRMDAYAYKPNNRYLKLVRQRHKEIRGAEKVAAKRREKLISVLQQVENRGLIAALDDSRSLTCIEQLAHMVLELMAVPPQPPPSPNSTVTQECDRVLGSYFESPLGQARRHWRIFRKSRKRLYSILRGMHMVALCEHVQVHHTVQFLAEQRTKKNKWIHVATTEDISTFPDLGWLPSSVLARICQRDPSSGDIIKVNRRKLEMQAFFMLKDAMVNGKVRLEQKTEMSERSPQASVAKDDVPICESDPESFTQLASISAGITLPIAKVAVS